LYLCQPLPATLIDDVFCYLFLPATNEIVGAFIFSFSFSTPQQWANVCRDKLIPLSKKAKIQCFPNFIF
jgi:hypothetical protein